MYNNKEIVDTQERFGKIVNKHGDNNDNQASKNKTTYDIHPILRFYENTGGKDWNITSKKLFNLFGIKTKLDPEYPYLRLFKYSLDSKQIDFYHPLTRESRGVIIDTEQNEVVCNPFQKFGNYGESYSQNIDWESAIVSEKLDGSLIKLWYNYKAETWVMSTNGSIDAYHADSMSTGLTFGGLIEKCVNYNDVLALITSNSLNTSKTYMFELVGDNNVIVVQSYPENMLHLIGIRNNNTGQEDDIYEFAKNHQVAVPKKYNFADLTLENIIDFLDTKDKKYGTDTTSIDYEGFVITDKDHRRIKVKSERYVALHKFVNGGNISIKTLFPLIRDGNIDDLIGIYPSLERKIKDIYNIFMHIKDFVRKQLIKVSVWLQENKGIEQSEYAKKILSNKDTKKIASFLFSMRKNNLTVSQTMKSINDSWYIDKIKEVLNDNKRQ